MTKGNAAGKKAKQPEVQSGAHLEAAESAKVKHGTVALVGKGTDRIPVQLKDEQHLAKLREEHGEGNVEVQS